MKKGQEIKKKVGDCVLAALKVAGSVAATVAGFAVIGNLFRKAKMHFKIKKILNILMFRRNWI